MEDLSFAPLEAPQGSATERVFDTLYDAVISVKLPPGTRVSEYEIAKQLGVSRQPVRDAFFRLSNLGFLSIRPQRPTLITQISLRTIHDAVFTRTALEVECLRVAFENNRLTLIKELQANIAAQQDALKASSSEFHMLDEAFHQLICETSGYGHVWNLIREQKAHLDRLRILSLSEARRQTVLAEHREIVDAIKTATLADCEALLRSHISGIKKVLPSIVESYPEYIEETS